MEESYISCCGFSGITKVAVKPAFVYEFSDRLQITLRTQQRALCFLVLKGRYREGPGDNLEGKVDGLDVRQMQAPCHDLEGDPIHAPALRIFSPHPITPFSERERTKS